MELGIKGSAEDQAKMGIQEIRRGLLKKKNEWYMQQTRTFVLTNEPRLRYYRNGTELRVSHALFINNNLIYRVKYR